MEVNVSEKTTTKPVSSSQGSPLNFTISREELLKPLQLVSGAVERRQTLPILSNVLLSVKSDKLTMTATDLELELASSSNLDKLVEEGDVTVSARKLLDICKTLPNETMIQFKMEKDRLLLRTPKSRFTLSTLPAAEFPNVEEGKGEIKFVVSQSVLKKTLEGVHFAMAQQDVRYYLNGMLFDLKSDGLKVVATDGHRLSLGHISEIEVPKKGSWQVIVPRKGIMELMRLLQDNDAPIEIVVGTNHIHASTDDFTFTSKLIEGKFPDYMRVIPKKGDKTVLVDRNELKQSLTRAAILSNEKYRGIRLFLATNTLKISANNPDQEEAEEELAVKYKGGELEIGFNVTYLLDICQAVSNTEIELCFADANSSLLVSKESDSVGYLYVVMPMRL